MKKWIIGLVVGALLILTIGSIAFAQEETPAAPGDWVPGTRGPGGRGNHGGGMFGPADGTGVMHDDMVAAISEALGISVEEFEARRDAGETMFEIAESLGFDFETLKEAMDQARNLVMENAFADGTISQEQYESYLNRGSENGGRGGRQGGHGGRGGGGFAGDCPFSDTDN